MKVRELQYFCKAASAQKYDYSEMLPRVYQDLYQKAAPTQLKNAKELTSNTQFNQEVETLIAYLAPRVGGNFNNLRSVFGPLKEHSLPTRGNYSQRNEVKIRLEKIACRILSDEKKIEVIKALFCDEKFDKCVDGTLQSFDDKMAQLEIQGFDSLVLLSVTQTINHIINEYIYANKAFLEANANLRDITPGEEKHNIASLRNMIADAWGIPQETKDRFVRNNPTADSAAVMTSFVNYMENQYETERFFQIIVQNIVSKLELPEFNDVTKPEFSRYLAECLSTYGLGIYVPHLLYIGANGVVNGYKKNHADILMHLVQATLWDAGISRIKKNEGLLALVEGDQCPDGGYYVTKEVEDEFLKCDQSKEEKSDIPAINRMIRHYIHHDLYAYTPLIKYKNIITPPYVLEAEERIIRIMHSLIDRNLDIPSVIDKPTTSAMMVLHLSADFFRRIRILPKMNLKCIMDRDDVEITEIIFTRAKLDRTSLDFFSHLGAFGRVNLLTLERDNMCALDIKQRIELLKIATRNRNALSAKLLLKTISVDVDINWIKVELFCLSVRAKDQELLGLVLQRFTAAEMNHPSCISTSKNGVVIATETYIEYVLNHGCSIDFAMKIAQKILRNESMRLSAKDTLHLLNNIIPTGDLDALKALENNFDNPRDLSKYVFIRNGIHMNALQYAIMAKVSLEFFQKLQSYFVIENKDLLDAMIAAFEGGKHDIVHQILQGVVINPKDNNLKLYLFILSVQTRNELLLDFILEKYSPKEMNDPITLIVTSEDGTQKSIKTTYIKYALRNCDDIGFAMKIAQKILHNDNMRLRNSDESHLIKGIILTADFESDNVIYHFIKPSILLHSISLLGFALRVLKRLDQNELITLKYNINGIELSLLELAIQSNCSDEFISQMLGERFDAFKKFDPLRCAIEYSSPSMAIDILSNTPDALKRFDDKDEHDIKSTLFILAFETKNNELLDLLLQIYPAEEIHYPNALLKFVNGVVTGSYTYIEYALRVGNNVAFALKIADHISKGSALHSIDQELLSLYMHPVIDGAADVAEFICKKGVRQDLGIDRQNRQ